ncbi:Uncharacterised protein [uncultured archaeon]|nr:Uncharacterised protein [uncultured archaeon]
MAEKPIGSYLRPSAASRKKSQPALVDIPLPEMKKEKPAPERKTELAEAQEKKAEKPKEEAEAAGPAKASANEGKKGKQKKAPKGKQDLFSRYSDEFNGERLSTGIGWLDQLWSDRKIMNAYQHLSDDPDARRKAVEDFVDYVKLHPDLYVKECRAEVMIPEIKSFVK